MPASYASGVSVTGMGVISSAGVGLTDNWKTLCEGRSRAAADPLLGNAPSSMSCRVPPFDERALLPDDVVWRTDRFIHLALVAAREAVADAAIDRDGWDPARIAVVMGVVTSSTEHFATHYAALAAGRERRISPLSMPRSLPNMAAAEISRDFGTHGPTFCVSTACASGSTAISTAALLLGAGLADVVIAGGAEAASDRMVHAMFAQMRTLSQRGEDPAAASRPFDRDRDGFVLGEGAAVMVLERTEDARRRGARVRARLTGHGSSSDAHHSTGPHPDGVGAELAIRNALDMAGNGTADIDHINAHGTSTRANDLMEGRVLDRLFPQAPPVTANKGVIGHCLGAGGAIEAVFTVLSLEHQLIPPTANHLGQDPGLSLDMVTGSPRTASLERALSTSFGFGGQNCALLFERNAP
ncbi:beta-ketoacyl-[acyl-carrier-protein] synthase family protein [Streptomyces sp. NBC_00663]|uniref:beta-ketoacyl-[acyl-carrier-protein] synthase family protein n=1 Tax=Streptomyces sp. NBC_00663 TaxID=2975801 RepID=UPI002E2F4B3C|nr:beta-ketoacyl-[acyl-carrier-protein] synthase family protein [Streptomyces sp. NBC_00663]